MRLSPDIYDVMILGAGIGGLYTAFRLLESNPRARVLVLEREDQPGGRIKTVPFAGVEVTTGAGVGRVRKDKRLMALLHRLEIPYQEFSAIHHFAKDVEGNCHPEKQRARWRQLQAVVRADPHRAKGVSFSRFASGVLGTHEYKAFVTLMGYTDMEHADALDTVLDYGLEDNMPVPWQGAYIPWKKLRDALVARIRTHGGKILTRCEALRMLHRPDGILVYTSQDVMYHTRRVVLATTISGIHELLPQCHHIYRAIRAQPFLRVYARFAKSGHEALASKVPGLTVVSNGLQEIIPIVPERGVYMIAYADNEAALSHLPHLHDPLYWEGQVSQALDIQRDQLKILSMQPHFWAEGTHFHAPHKKEIPYHTLQRPMPNVFVVGEAVARHQGWVDGVLASVEMVLKDLGSSRPLG